MDRTQFANAFKWDDATFTRYLDQERISEELYNDNNVSGIYYTEVISASDICLEEEISEEVCLHLQDFGDMNVDVYVTFENDIEMDEMSETQIEEYDDWEYTIDVSITYDALKEFFLNNANNAPFNNLQEYAAYLKSRLEDAVQDTECHY